VCLVFQLAGEFDNGSNGDDATAIKRLLTKLQVRRQLCDDSLKWVHSQQQTFKLFLTALSLVEPKLADLQMTFQTDLEQVHL
jgi:hypothetical protein